MPHVTDLIGRPLTLNQIEEYRDHLEGTPAQLAGFERWADAQAEKWADQMEQTYAGPSARAAGEAKRITRAAERINEELDAILDDLEHGRITQDNFREVTARIGRLNQEQQTLRGAAESVAQSEGRAWSRIDMQPGEFQHHISERFPALFSRGRGALSVLTADDLAPSRRGRKRTTTDDAPDEDDLRRAGYSGR